MRKFLVASQKGGVGKTTTSIHLALTTARAGARALLLDADPLSSISLALNLAEHPRRQALREQGVDLPGALVADLVPGLDVFSPYEAGGCSDEEMDRVLALFASEPIRERYQCLIVDTPPFLGASPAQLLGTCEEYLLVMRAEAMAARTLPAFLELVQRSNKSIRFRGILLTLGEGEDTGGRWERELRGRYGTRILAPVVPYDEALGQGPHLVEEGPVAGQAGPASRAYRSVVESLTLAVHARPKQEATSAIEVLLLAAATMKNAAPARKPVSRKVKRPEMVPTAPAEPARSPNRPLTPVAPPSPPHYEALPEPVRRRLTPAAPIPVVAPSRRAEAPAEAAAPRPKERPRKQAPRDEGPGFPLWMGLVWVGVAIGAGVGMRFLELPTNVMPILAGVVVAAIVVVLLRAIQERSVEPPPPPAPRRSRGSNQGDNLRRLSDLARRAKSSAHEAAEN